MTFLHIACNASTRPSRILKESGSALRAGLTGNVVILARAAEGHAMEEHPAEGVRIERVSLRTGWLPRRGPMQIVKLLDWQARVFRRAVGLRPRLVHAHSLCTLAVSLRIGREVGCPVVYDAHELETDQGQPRWRRPIDRLEEARLIRKPAAMLCVSESIADWYANRYEISRPVVVRNVPDVRIQRLGADREILRQRFSIPDASVVFIYQGVLSPGRRVEQLLRVFGRVGDARHIVFMGYGPLEGMVREAASVRANVHFLPAVPPNEVLRYSAGADVGICGVENTCLSYFYSLPNKLFEYLLAGVPALVPRWPELLRVVEQNGFGWVVGDSDEAWISAVTETNRAAADALRPRVLAGASEYSWEREEGRLLTVYRTLLDQGVAFEA